MYRSGYEAAFTRLDEWVSATDGLLTFGRQGLFAHDNTHHALAMGVAAAEALRPDGTLDVSGWTSARASFREHVVED